MRTVPPPLSDTRTPHERMESDFQELDATLREALLQRVTGISPTAFEYLIVDLLVSMGYTIYEIGNSIGLDENENIFFIEDSKET